MSSNLRWIFVDNPPGAAIAQWKRSSAIDDDGRVFVPAVLFGPEGTIFLCISYDGQPIVYDDGHLYVPADWAAGEFPDMADACRLIERKTRDHFAGK
jgi:hypothetical protein